MSRFHTTEFDLLPERAFQRRGGPIAKPATLEGGKGNNVPAPDPRLVEAQVRSMGYQDQAIQQIMANANRMLPLQEQQLQFGLQAARTAYDQSLADREWMLDRRAALGGLQDQLVSDATGFNPTQRGNELAAQGAADVAQAFGTARGTQARTLSAYGLNPNKGAFGGFNANMNIQEALAKAGAMTRGRQAGRTEGYALTDRATNALAGYPAMGMQATGAGAGFGGMGLTLANTGLGGMNAGFNAAGGLGGALGQNATGMYGQQANAYARDQENQGGFWGTVLGVGGQLGAAALGGARFSDRRVKENVAPVGKDDRTGLTLYEFNYIGYPDKRFRGVMAEEVESKYPDAVDRDDTGYMLVDYDKLGIEFREV